ncbi:MAG: hypothetical protein R3228_18460 [Halioglobus sp.]|nr:hypothetical protein [Halioglobus sp.]
MKPVPATYKLLVLAAATLTAPAAMAFINPVPEPDIMALFGAAGVSLVLAERWRRNRRK